MRYVMPNSSSATISHFDSFILLELGSSSSHLYPAHTARMYQLNSARSNVGNQARQAGASCLPLSFTKRVGLAAWP